MTKVLQLKQQLQNTKKGSMYISEYCLKINTLGDGLRVVGQTVTEYNMVLNILSGLGHDYDPVVVLVSSQHKSMSMEEAQYFLMVHEQRLEQLNSASSIAMTRASVRFASSNTFCGGHSLKNKGSNNSRRSRGRGRNNSWWNNNNRVSCQLCSKLGHSALQCYRRFDQRWYGQLTNQPQHVAERKHRHLVETDLTILAHAHMTLKF
ncbi:hypothetical protein ACOSP7_007499 [Xanthoceras sorbifolium]